MLQKGVYPYEDMDDCEKFNLTSSLPEKEEFYSHVNMKDTTDVDYAFLKSCKGFKIKKLGEYHDLYV